MSKPNIETIAEATQVGAGEFYQVMSESFQANYPVTTGLMPWVYKRPWPVVAAIHLVDGYGQPSAPYYFLKRTYYPIHVMLDIERLLWAPGEKFPIRVKVLNGVNQHAIDASVEVKIWDYQFKEIYKERKEMAVVEGTSVSMLEMEDFVIPDRYKENYFFVTVSLYNDKNQQISQTNYWSRTIKEMENRSYYDKFVSEPVVWPALDKGPWLKSTVSKTKTSLDITDLQTEALTDSRKTISFTVRNTGKSPSFMTTMDIEGASRSFYANDNFFWLNPGESKQIRIELLLRDQSKTEKLKLVVKSWNAKMQEKIID